VSGFEVSAFPPQQKIEERSNIVREVSLVRRLEVWLVILIMVGTLQVFAEGQQDSVQPKEKVTLVWINSPGVNRAAGEGKVFEQFTQETGIQIDIETIPGKNMATKVSTELLAHSGHYDILSVNDTFFTRTLAGHLEPLNSYFQSDPPSKDIIPAMIWQFSVPQSETGTVYALPFRMGQDIMFARKDLLNNAGLSIPRSWDEYYDAAKKLTDLTADPPIYGAIFQGDTSVSSTMDFFSWSRPRGMEFLSLDGSKAAFNTEPGLNALSLRKRFLDDGLAPRGVINYTHSDAIAAMQQGVAAMTIMYGAYNQDLEDPAKSRVAGKMVYAAIPRKAGVSKAYPTRGWGLCVNKYSKNKAAAWEVLKFLTQPETQITCAVDYVNAPVNSKVFDADSFKRQVKAAEALKEAAKYGTIMVAVPDRNQIMTVFSQYANRTLIGELTPQQALDQAERKINEILAEGR
jgi:multiple sugar transport system substrate-binding protein